MSTVFRLPIVDEPPARARGCGCGGHAGSSGCSRRGSDSCGGLCGTGRTVNDGSAGPLLAPERRVLSTLNDDGSRRWMSPRLSPGRWRSRRLALGWSLIVLFAALPWLRIDGKPPILLDVMTRKFTFFGETYRPTDTPLLALVILGTFVGIFLLTALFGRVWCGWACPQTVYLEFVYRPLERFFLGRAALDPKAGVAPWRRVAMYAAWIVISAHLANTLLAWFVGADRLSEWIFRATPAAHPVAFAVFAATTLLMLFDFAFFREQLCSLVCPYGRFQSALLDRDSLIVGYDARRGEPRGRKARTSGGGGGCGGCGGCDRAGGCGSGESCGGHGKVPAHAARGDCVDCRLCVTTCPAGIDIRDGMQLECIQCTQCIDACDAVMTKLGRPTGLVRYSSQAALEGAPRQKVRARLIVYPTLLAVLVGAAGYLLATRQDAAVAVLRTQGVPYAVKEQGTAQESVESIVRLRIDNRTREAHAYTVTGGEGVELVRAGRVEVAGDSSSEVDVVVRSAPGQFDRGRREAELLVREEGGREGAFRGSVTASVLGPLVIVPPKEGAP